MKMEIELNDDQAKKVGILKENGIEVGDAIDMLFDLKHSFADTKLNQAHDRKAELEEELAKIDEEISMFTKMKDGSLDPTQYDESVQDAKHKFKWTNILKF